MQLFSYELHNKHIRKHNEDASLQEKGEKTFDEVILDELQ